MKRREFVHNMASLGLGIPFLSWLLPGCGEVNYYPKTFDVNFSGKVLIIGSGAAGLTAGHLLNQYGIDFEIIEAKEVWGGRLRKDTDLAEFPIDLGAEWIHTNPDILSKMLNEPNTNVDIELVHYLPETIKLWKNEKLVTRNFFLNFYYGEYKFKRTTWYDFFADYVVPKISDKIRLNSPVTEIDYSGDKVFVRDLNGNAYEGDKILVTVPVTMLQNNSIAFSPALPASKTEALGNVRMPPILKVFMKFSERFYPDLLQIGGLGSLLAEETGGLGNLFYDAALFKESPDNVLSLFSIGSPAEPLTALETEEEVIAAVLAQLDEIYDGRPSELLVDYRIQDWTKEPYIEGSYSHYDQAYTASVEAIAEPIDNKVFFAGEAVALSGNTATVHGASEAAYAAVGLILKS